MSTRLSQKQSNHQTKHKPFGILLLMDDITWPPKQKIAPKTRRKKKQTPKAQSGGSASPIEGINSGPTVATSIGSGLKIQSLTDAPDLDNASLAPEPVVDEPTPAPDGEPNADPTNLGPVAMPTHDYEDSGDTSMADETPDTSPKKRGIYFKKVQLSKKKWALVIATVLVLVGAGGYGALKLYNRSKYIAPQGPVQKPTPKPVPPPKPKTEPSQLTGAEVAPELNKRPVTGIMIENSLDARPQAGLKEAGIIFEAIAEGGITRFLALYQDTQPDYIGPIRSARPYYLDFLMPFDASIAHVGGAPQALSDIRNLGVKDLDQYFNSGAYVRINTRYAPHNVYSDFGKFDALNVAKGFSSSTFAPWLRKKAAPAKVPTAKAIDIAISGPTYDVHYDYDAASNKYLRSEAGEPHKDDRSSTQLSPDVVVALVVGRGIDPDGQHTDYQTSGTGHMFVFQDGIQTEGTWSKADRKSPYTFTDAAGKPMALNPGQTWLTLVDNIAKVNFAP